MPQDSNTNPPECPRCGYDLSGEVTRWAEQCPLEGLCNECGLEIRWSSIFSIDGQRLPGFVEHSLGFIGTFKAGVTTWLWAIVPWIFWRRVRLEHRWVARRAFLWVISLVLVPKLLASIALSIGFLIPSIGTRKYAAIYTFIMNCFLEPLWTVDASSAIPSVTQYGMRLLTEYLVIPSIATLCFPMTLLLLPTTMGDARVRMRHILRAGAYSCAPWVLLGMTFFISRFLIAVATATAPTARPGPFGSTFSDSILRLSFNIVEFAADWVKPIGFLWFLWLLVWWFCALKLGFRMKCIAWPVVAMLAIVPLATFTFTLMLGIL